MAYKDNLGLIRQMLAISGSVDIETAGIRSGAGIHELSYGTFGEGKTPGNVAQYVLEPSSVLSVSETGALTPYVRGQQPFVYRPGSWQAVDAVNIMLDQGKPLHASSIDETAKAFIKQRSGPQFLKELGQTNEFRANTYRSGKFPWLPRIRESTLSLAKKHSIPIGDVKTERLAVEAVLKSDSGFSRKLRNNVTWIANAQFESRQIGANLDVMERSLTEQAMAEGIEEHAAQKRAHGATFRNSLAWQNPRQTGLLYTTGPEYNRARAAALTGTGKKGWIGVWESLLKNTKAGDVRDIFDVMKAQEGYVRKIMPGFLPEEGLVTGGVDIQNRLMRGLDQGAKGLLITEAHMGALDVPVQEYMVKKLLPQTAALQAIAEGTKEGAELLTQARAGKGIVSDVLKRMSMTMALMPDQQTANILKRLDQATSDIAVRGVSEQNTRHKVVGVKQINRAGQESLVDVAIPKASPFTTLDSVVERMSQSKQYPEELLQREVAAYKLNTEGFSGEELLHKSRKYVDERSLALPKQQEYKEAQKKVPKHS